MDVAIVAMESMVVGPELRVFVDAHPATEVMLGAKSVRNGVSSQVGPDGMGSHMYSVNRNQRARPSTVGVQASRRSGGVDSLLTRGTFEGEKRACAWT